MSHAPMLGNWPVQVRSVRPFTIHSDLYYELHVFRLDEPTGQLLAIRVPQHAVTEEPKPGDKLTLTFLMGQVTSARKEPEQPGPGTR